MRTSIDLPDGMFRRLKATAALRGVTMKTLVSAALERELREETPAVPDEPFPVIRSASPGSLHLTSERIAQILGTEDCHVPS